jgi:glucokinase
VSLIEPIEMNESIIGVDLGGTWMRAAVIASSGTCGDIVRRPTRRDRDPADIVADLAGLVAEVRGSNTNVADVALGIPTLEDEHGGLVASDNLPTMAGFPLRTRIAALLHMNVRLFNDANCFAVGEWWQGSGHGTKNMCGVTLGTGLGAGLIVNGSLYRGSHGYAGEIWKSPFDDGTAEKQACGATLERLYEQANGRRISGAEIEKLARAGEAAAMEAFSVFGRSLGRVMAFLANVMDPELIVFGGSVSAAFDLFEAGLRQAFVAGTVAGNRIKLSPSVLGERAALLGAARLFEMSNAQE